MGRMWLPSRLLRGTQRCLVCRPPTGPSPARAPQGHLQPGTSPKSLHSCQPHDSPAPRDVHPASAQGFEGSPRPQATPRDPLCKSTHQQQEGEGLPPRLLVPWAGERGQEWLDARPNPFFARKGIFGAAFRMNLQLSHSSRAVLRGTNRGEQRREAEQQSSRAGKCRKGGICGQMTDLNFRVSVNVWLSTPGAAGLMFLPVPYPFLRALRVTSQPRSV